MAMDRLICINFAKKNFQINANTKVRFSNFYLLPNVDYIPSNG